jgi:hypothetical protein
MSQNSESARLEEVRTAKIPWRKWGPYLSKRQWGTVREDYSQDGNVWDYFTHDQPRSRAYHCGEDGIAGISPSASLHFSIYQTLTLSTVTFIGSARDAAPNSGARVQLSLLAYNLGNLWRRPVLPKRIDA